MSCLPGIALGSCLYEVETQKTPSIEGQIIVHVLTTFVLFVEAESRLVLHNCTLQH